MPGKKPGNRPPDGFVTPLKAQASPGKGGSVPENSGALFAEDIRALRHRKHHRSWRPAKPARVSIGSFSAGEIRRSFLYRASPFFNGLLCAWNFVEIAKKPRVCQSSAEVPTTQRLLLCNLLILSALPPTIVCTAADDYRHCCR
jgi:hypothetical protein